MGMKLFLRTFFITFLGLILLVNLIYFANLGSVMLAPQVDYSNKYVGFSSILEFIRSFGNDSLLNSLRTFAEDYLYELRKVTISGFEAFGGVYDLVSFFSAFGRFIAACFSLFGYAFYPLLYLIYALMFVVVVFSKFVYLLYGGYMQQIPPNIYGL